MTLLETERLLLRKWQAADLPAFAAMNRDPDVMRFFPSVLTDEETRAFYDRIQQHFSEHNFGLYVVAIKDSGAFAGFTGFMIPRFEAAFTPCVEIGWRFNKQYWGKGYATEAALACLEFGFNTLLFEQVYSFTAWLNTRSILLMQRIGMRYLYDFMHPRIDVSHPICQHVLYKINKQVFKFQ